MTAIRWLHFNVVFKLFGISWFDIAGSLSIVWFAFSEGKESFEKANQRHELKFAGIYNWKSLYFSANYIYDSGFEIMKSFNDSDNSIPFYSRLDADVIYKFNKWKVNGNLGLSVLNVLNCTNIKYSNLRRVESSTSEIVNVIRKPYRLLLLYS